MSILDQLGSLLGRYSGGSQESPPPEEASEHLQQVAAGLPQSQLSRLLSSVFSSSETGTFGQNIAQMFGQSNPQQKAGILAKLGVNAGDSEATEVSASRVEEMANEEQRRNPGIVQQAADFYSQHPQLVQGLGTVAAAWALRRVSQAQSAT